MHILSYDIASKSLALSIIYFNDKWKDNLTDIKKSFKQTKYQDAMELCKHAIKHIEKIEQLFNNLIVPKLFDVVDLIPGKKLKDTTPILRASRLRGYLNKVDSYYLQNLANINDSCKVLLEYQMGPNDKSRNVGSQILYHYSMMDNAFKRTYVKPCNTETQNVDDNPFADITIEIRYDVEIVGPSLKNKLNFDKEKPHQYFIKKYAKMYDANKKHSTTNLLYWVKKNNVEHMIENIPKKNIDDIADAVNMTLAWIFIKSNCM